MRPKQETFAEAGFEKYRKPTRREEFLAQMNTVVPWEKLTGLIEPVYPHRRRRRAPADRSGADAAHSLSAALVQSVAIQPLKRRCTTRARCASLCGIDLGREPASG